MKFISKLLIILTILTVIVFALFGCSVSESSKDYIADNKIINDILEKLSISDEKLIKDLVQIDSNYYFICLSEDNKIQKLYKYRENEDIKLLFEKDYIELHESEKFLYIYYDDINSKLKHNIVYINDFENDSVNELYNFNDSAIKFSNKNEYFAVLNNFSLTIFKENKTIYNDKLTVDEYTEQNMSELNPINSLEFSSDDKMLFVSYSLNSLKNLFYKIDLSGLDIKEYSFDKHGYYGDESFKFNTDTGDVLYVSSYIYPEHRHPENDMSEYDFLESAYNKIEYKYDDKDKFLYLRNIYTQEMFVVDKLESSNQSEYDYNFTKDNKIEINGKIITKDIRTKENLAYTQMFSENMRPENAGSTLKIDEEAAQKISKFIKDNYDIDSEAIFSIGYKNLSYVIVNIPGYHIYNNKYERYGNSTIELWRYENGECKRLLYNQNNLSVYNMIDKGYLMISGYPGYVVKFDSSNDVIYESKYTGFSKSPDNKYVLIYNGNESFSLLENDKIVLSHNFFGNDDINTFWYYTVEELAEYWWDLDFGKLYILIGPATRPSMDIFCVDLENKQVQEYDKIKFWSNEVINKEFGYIYFENSVFTGDLYGYYQELYINKKFGNYIYNLRTNEKFYLTDYISYDLTKSNEDIITYSQEDGSSESSKLTIDIGFYIDKNRMTYLNSIKNTIIENHDKTISIDDIELCQIFNTDKSKYQIVKIGKKDSDKFNYELWKIDKDNYEKISDNADKMFLTNNQKTLCIVSNSGELKVYDENFNCIIDENIYSDRLLSKFDKSALEIADYYTMQFDNNIFLTIKSDNMLVDTVNIDLINKRLSFTADLASCPYDNYYIDPITGYLIYQTGSSVIQYNEEYNYYSTTHKSDDRSLVAINLINMKKQEIDKDYCFYILNLDSDKNKLSYSKSYDGTSVGGEIIYNFNKSFINY